MKSTMKYLLALLLLTPPLLTEEHPKIMFSKVFDFLKSPKPQKIKEKKPKKEKKIKIKKEISIKPTKIGPQGIQGLMGLKGEKGDKGDSVYIDFKELEVYEMLPSGEIYFKTDRLENTNVITFDPGFYLVSWNLSFCSSDVPDNMIMCFKQSDTLLSQDTIYPNETKTITGSKIFFTSYLSFLIQDCKKIKLLKGIVSLVRLR